MIEYILINNSVLKMSNHLGGNNMKKIIGISAAVIIALFGLYYFFYGNYSTNPSTNQSASSSSVKTKHKHKNKINSSSSSSSSEVSNAYANELSTQDWYMLAYIDQWHLTIDEATNLAPVLGYRSSPRAAIDTGTVDSECLLHGITTTTVTVAPSSGEGAWSTYKDVTLSKQHLLSYVHSRADITKLNTIISRGLQKDQQDRQVEESAKKAADNSSQSNDTETSDASESN